MDQPNGTPPSPDIVKSLWKVTKVVLDTLDFNEVTQKICDSLLSELGYLNLGYRIIVLSLYREDCQCLQRISLSQTPEAEAATSVSTIPFHDILIPLSATENYGVKAFLEQKEYVTQDWKDILCPPLEPEDARRNQQSAGIKTSMVFPVVLRGKSVGFVIFSMVKDYSDVSQAELDLIRGFTEIIGIAVQNARLYSDLQKTSADLDTANKHLQQLDKAKDEFVSLASHELRTPMTAIKSYVWMVLNDKAKDKTKDYLQLVFNSTERLIHLVNDMLDISRIESGRVQLKLAPFNMPELLTQIIDEFKARAADKKIKLDLDLKEKLPLVTADRDKIMQVLENLVGNSLKFTEANGMITLTARAGEKYLETSVTDTGRGVSEDEIGKLFTKFERGGSPLTTLSEPGTGLGLYLCKQYIELHKGTISVKSKLGQGSTFAFALPLN